MKKLHLICNSHLDPIWMWDWQEGATAALATFYQAVELADEFDYIFCHNEAVLYEFIEKYNPTLFAKIRELVKKGKWHIMGGWYLQPDCHIPSGEGFVRQIRYGQAYFREKFGKTPTTAINFDSFGHSVGLVQILKKCGYDSYLFCRPMPEMLDLPDNVFYWVGLDGSKIKACRFEDDTIYCSGFGTSKADILRKIEKWKDKEIGMALWGVGNHGGNPSRKDLRDIEEMIKTADYEILHSTPEAFFAEVEPSAEYKGALNHCLVGCYASVSVIKKMNAELESKLFSTEKICALANLQYGHEYDIKAFERAQKELLFIQFHDVLSGTSVVEGVESSVRRMQYAMKILDELYFSAFTAMVERHKKAEEGSFPTFFFNDCPYERETVVESEFLVLDSLISDTEEYGVKAFYDGKEIPCQVLKQSCNINYDRRKRLACKIKVPPATMARVDYYIEKRPLSKKNLQNRELVFEDSCKRVVIGKDSGLIESFVVNGKEYLAGGAFEPTMYEDIADPWGWGLKKVGENAKAFALSKNDIFAGLRSINVTEDGDILTEIECYFECGQSFVKLSYKIYKDTPYVDVKAYVLWNEREKALKLKIPTTQTKAFLGQTAFGTENHPLNGEECVAHRFIAMKDEGEDVFAVYNKGVYGFANENGTAYMTLLRGVAYCAHPIDDRPLLPWERFVPYVEQGKHEFSFRVCVCKQESLEKYAEEFCAPTFSVNAYPHGEERNLQGAFTLTNENIAVKALKKSKGGAYVLRFINNYERAQECDLHFGNADLTLRFTPFEVKTVVYDGIKIKEEIEMLI